MPRPWEDPSTLLSTQKEASPEMVKVEEPVPSTINAEEGESDYEAAGRGVKSSEEKRQEKHDRHEKRRKKEKEKSMNPFRIEHLQEHICILSCVIVMD
ncbi:hypothetical protein V6N11_030424 [Hibiscus sabdariffa]|uniref:Uncharacterized protein n=1 Tax=Hibiscus sabdariffa TaxID=183260 RepID=A0ABR2PL99_9ROSI